MINRAIDDPFDQPGSNLVASPKSDKPCFLSELLAGKSSRDVAGGPWARVMSGQMTTSMTSSTTNVTSGDFLGSAMSRQRIDYTGVQTGVDSGLLNLEGIGVNAHVGVTGGQVSAQANSTNSLRAWNGSSTNTVSWNHLKCRSWERITLSRRATS